MPIIRVAGAFEYLALRLWRDSFFTRGGLPLLLPAQKVAALAGAVVALLAGFGVTVWRID